MPVSVLLADDAEIVRTAIRSLLTDSRTIVQIVGEAADLPQTIQMAHKLKPQVIVMDLHIARASEPSEVKTNLRDWKLLAMSLSNDDEAKALAESYGALALLDKIDLSDELLPAIVRVASPPSRAATTYSSAGLFKVVQIPNLDCSKLL